MVRYVGSLRESADKSVGRRHIDWEEYEINQFLVEPWKLITPLLLQWDGCRQTLWRLYLSPRRSSNTNMSCRFLIQDMRVQNGLCKLKIILCGISRPGCEVAGVVLIRQRQIGPHDIPCNSAFRSTKIGNTEKNKRTPRRRIDDNGARKAETATR